MRLLFLCIFFYEFLHIWLLFDTHCVYLAFGLPFVLYFMFSERTVATIW